MPRRPRQRPSPNARGYLYADRKLIGFGRRGFHVERLDRRVAVGVIRACHYAHTHVNNAYVHLGVFQRNILVGVIQLGYAMNPRSMGRVVTGTAVDEYLELNRMWLSDEAPRNSESQALSYAIKFIRRAYPKVRWIQSFADERCGKYGVVYQAASFLYVGSHRTPFYLLDGVWYHKILVTAVNKSGNRGRTIRANLHRAERHDFRQFRYIRFLKPRCRRYLRLPVLPYPKPCGPSSGRPAAKRCEPGSTPGGRSTSPV